MPVLAYVVQRGVPPPVDGVSVRAQLDQRCYCRRTAPLTCRMQRRVTTLVGGVDVEDSVRGSVETMTISDAHPNSALLGDQLRHCIRMAP